MAISHLLQREVETKNRNHIEVAEHHLTKPRALDCSQPQHFSCFKSDFPNTRQLTPPPKQLNKPLNTGCAINLSGRHRHLHPWPTPSGPPHPMPNLEQSCIPSQTTSTSQLLRIPDHHILHSARLPGRANTQRARLQLPRRRFSM